MKLVLSLVILSVILNTIGQLLFKIGMNQVGNFSFTWGNILPIAWKLVSNMALISGLFVYFMSTIVWFLVLSRSELSFAYPLLSMGYIVNLFSAYYILHEPAFSPMRLLGTLIIILGVIIVCQN